MLRRTDAAARSARTASLLPRRLRSSASSYFSEQGLLLSRRVHFRLGWLLLLQGSGSRAQAQKRKHCGSGVLRHVKSAGTRNQTHIS
ncbi:hypothetical protein R6Z07F_015214 [Ovis aries]